MTNSRARSALLVLVSAFVAASWAAGAGAQTPPPPPFQAVLPSAGGVVLVTTITEATPEQLVSYAGANGCAARSLWVDCGG
ncbi:MAG: hypothetical protein O3A76_07030, partial [Chloroflexi bacterium]|nr:hypothetical protein [Chloroflexota bacterium]